MICAAFRVLNFLGLLRLAPDRRPDLSGSRAKMPPKVNHGYLFWRACSSSLAEHYGSPGEYYTRRICRSQSPEPPLVR